MNTKTPNTPNKLVPVWVSNQCPGVGWDCTADYLRAAGVPFTLVNYVPHVADFEAAAKAVSLVGHGPDMEDWEARAGDPELVIND